MNRKELLREKRNKHLRSHLDAETAEYFINLWNNDEVGEVCERIDTSLRKYDDRPIFTNSARNKLTEYGNKVALETLLSIPTLERACKFARWEFEELKEKLSKGFQDESQKENFLIEREHWFSHLKERMKDLRISKETLQTFGLDFKAAKSFYYQAI